MVRAGWALVTSPGLKPLATPRYAQPSSVAPSRIFLPVDLLVTMHADEICDPAIERDEPGAAVFVPSEKAQDCPNTHTAPVSAAIRSCSGASSATGSRFARPCATIARTPSRTAARSTASRIRSIAEPVGTPPFVKRWPP